MQMQGKVPLLSFHRTFLHLRHRSHCPLQQSMCYVVLFCLSIHIHQSKNFKRNKKKQKEIKRNRFDSTDYLILQWFLSIRNVKKYLRQK